MFSSRLISAAFAKGYSVIFNLFFFFNLFLKWIKLQDWSGTEAHFSNSRIQQTISL